MRKSRTRKIRNPFWDQEKEAWKPPEELTVSQCADKYRVLSTKSARPGRWETSFLPFNREIMDAFALDCIEEIWFQKPTQIGGTDAILNMILYAALQDPGPAMVVESNRDLANEISNERIDEMIRTCDALKEVQSSDQDDTTQKKKTFSSMTVYLAWAGSPSSLASRPIRYVFFDEINKYGSFSGQEASPLALGKERTQTFIFTRKIIYVSTPTIENGYISSGERVCDARFRFHIFCPHCGKTQQLIFPQVKFGEERDPKKVEEISWYECEACKGIISDSEKMELIRRGKWVDLNSGLDFNSCMETLKPKRIGFQISRLYSPWHTFGMIAAEFLRSKNDLMMLMNWRNAWMGEEWVERIMAKKEEDILRHIDEKLAPLIIPRGTIALTGGIDPGQGGFWFIVVAWIKQGESYSIHIPHYGFLTDWGLVRQILIEGAYQGEDGRAFPVWRSGVDTGGSEYGDEHISMTEDAYNFLRRFGGGRIFGTKGAGAQRSGRRMSPSIIDKMPKSNQPIPGGLTLWLIHSDEFKDILHYRLQINPGEPGGISFHNETGDDLAKHLTAEEKRRKKDGTSEWIIISRMNHWLDCLCMALAMGDTEAWGGVRILSRPQAKETEMPKIVIEEKLKSDSAAEIMARTLPAKKTSKESNWIDEGKDW